MRGRGDASKGVPRGVRGNALSILDEKLLNASPKPDQVQIDQWFCPASVITLPATLQKEAITLTLAAESGKQTPRIHEVRLCK